VTVPVRSAMVGTLKPSVYAGFQQSFRTVPLAPEREKNATFRSWWNAN